jgi:chromosomal replication initiator protein
MSAGDARVRRLTIESIQRAVSDLFGLCDGELHERNRTRAVTVPRQIAIYLAKQMTDASLPEIGRHFGGQHHTSVMHSIAKIEELRRIDPATDAAIGKLMKNIKAD